MSLFNSNEEYKIKKLESSLAQKATQHWVDVTRSPYGIKGDGTDETSKLQNAFNDGEGKTVYVPDNVVIKVNSTVRLKSGTTLIFGKNSKIVASSTFADTYVLANDDYTTILNNVVATQAITSGQDFLYLADVTNVQKGQFLTISNNLNPPAETYSVGEIHEIKSVDVANKKLTLTKKFRNAFTTVDLISVIEFAKDITLENVAIDTADKTKNLSAINMIYVRNAKLKGVKCFTGGRNGILFYIGVDSIVEGCYIEKFDDSVTSTGRTGYGIAFSGINLKALNNVITGCKHAIASSDRRYISVSLTYEGNHAYDCQDSWAYDFHDNYVDAKMINNYAENCLTGAGIRCEGALVKDNTFVNVNKGVEVKESGCSLSKIIGNKVYNFAETAVFVYGATKPLKDLIIRDNEFYNQTGGGILINTNYDSTVDGEGLFIENNIFDEVKSGQRLFSIRQIGSVKIVKNKIKATGDISGFILFQTNGVTKNDFIVDGNVVIGNQFTSHLIEVSGTGFGFMTVQNNYFNINKTTGNYFRGIVDGTIYVVNKTIMNNYRKDLNTFYSLVDTRDACRYRQGSGTTVPTGTLTAVPFNAALYDTNSMLDGTNPTRIVTKKSGVYHITAGVVWQGNATGKREIEIRKNGSEIVGRSTVLPISSNMYQQVSGSFNFTTNDYVELYVTQDSGASLTLFADSTNKHPFIAVDQITNG